MNIACASFYVTSVLVSVLVMGICSTWLSSKFLKFILILMYRYALDTQHFKKKKEELEPYEYFVSLHDLVLLVPRQE